MKLKAIVDRAEDYDKKNLSELTATFYTEADTDPIREALPTISAACIQSSMRLVKIHKTEDREFVVVDAENGEPAAIQSLTQDLLDNHDVELGSDNHDPDTLYVIADLPEELREDKEEEEGDSK